MDSPLRNDIKAKSPQQFNFPSFRSLVVTVSSLIAICIFYKLSVLLINGEIAPFDERAYSFIRQPASRLMDKFMLSATFLGDTEFVIFPVIGLFIYYTFIHRRRWYAIKVLAVSIGCTAVNLLLKQLFGRERPMQDHMVEVTNLSFPSGHAMFSMAFYGLLIYFVAKEAMPPIIKTICFLLLVLLIFSIGISRVYLGVHYASDIVAGFAAGYIWLVFILTAISVIKQRTQP